MLTPAQKDVLGRIIEGVKMKRVQQSQQAAADRSSQQDRQHQMAMTKAKGQALTARPGTKAKAPSGSKSAPKDGAAPSGITPYLTGEDLMGVSNATAQAENTDAEARFGYAKAAADALRASGDIERSRVAGVSGANDDAAARGLYDSGIRAGNVGMQNTQAARGQSQVQGALGMAAVQAVAQRQAARNQLGDFLGASAVKAAENGRALPVDPYATTPMQGTNVKGVSTARKSTTKRRGAALKPRGGKALI